MNRFRAWCKDAAGVFAVLLAFVLVFLFQFEPRQAHAAPGGGGVSVTVVNTVPTPTDDVNAAISCSGTPPGTTLVTANNARQAIALQNNASVAICISKSLTAMAACPPAASATAGSWVLKAATVAGDGSGGTINFSQYSGSLACLSSGAAGLVTVFSFAR